MRWAVVFAASPIADFPTHPPEVFVMLPVFNYFKKGGGLKGAWLGGFFSGGMVIQTVAFQKEMLLGIRKNF